jgi:hypothetical protein
MAGVGTRLLTLEVDGQSATDEVSVAKVTAGASDSDFLTFADAAAGGARAYNLVMTAVQDMVADTLWDLMWSAPGTEVVYTIAPYGNATPSPSQPHFTGSAIVSEPDGDLIGGEADVSTTARMTFDATWQCTAKPVKVVA